MKLTTTPTHDELKDIAHELYLEMTTGMSRGIKISNSELVRIFTYKNGYVEYSTIYRGNSSVDVWTQKDIETDEEPNKVNDKSSIYDSLMDGARRQDKHNKIYVAYVVNELTRSLEMSSGKYTRYT